MSQQTQERQVGDTLKTLPFKLVYRDENGRTVPHDLTGLTVKFQMLRKSTGVVKIAETTTGVDITDDEAGEGDYTFLSGGVDTAGIFMGYITVYDGSARDTYPVIQDELRIEFSSTTQTAQEAG